MEEICYQRNPIKEAIARIDFLNPIVQFSTEIPIEIASVIKEMFPIAEPRELIARELQISKEGVKQNENKTKEWNFHNRERNRKIVITQNSFILIHYNYESYDKFNADFFSIFNPIFNLYNVQSQRFGIRFVNNIAFDKGDPFNWSQYLNKNLLCIFNIPDKKESISRAFHNLELNYGDFNLRFQYGMHNPDYPAQIKKKVFILDFDAHYIGLMSKTDIDSCFPKFHDAIQNLFENSITEKYRKVLSNE